MKHIDFVMTEWSDEKISETTIIELIFDRNIFIFVDMSISI